MNFIRRILEPKPEANDPFTGTGSLVEQNLEAIKIVGDIAIKIQNKRQNTIRLWVICSSLVALILGCLEYFVS